jgi:hypothetical protein
VSLKHTCLGWVENQHPVALNIIIKPPDCRRRRAQAAAGQVCAARGHLLDAVSCRCFAETLGACCPHTSWANHWLFHTPQWQPQVWPLGLEEWARRRGQLQERPGAAGRALLGGSRGACRMVCGVGARYMARPLPRACFQVACGHLINPPLLHHPIIRSPRPASHTSSTARPPPRTTPTRRARPAGRRTWVRTGRVRITSMHRAPLLWRFAKALVRFVERCVSGLLL